MPCRNSEIISLASRSAFNSLPNKKFLESSKLKALADDDISVIQQLNFRLGRVKKHCGKRRKCMLPAFSPFPTMYSKVVFYGVVKSFKDCVERS